MTSIPASEPALGALTVKSTDVASAVSDAASTPADAPEAQSIDMRIRSAIAEQSREMDLARAAVAQAATALLQPVLIPPRNRQPLRQVRGEKEIAAELRQALRELRRFI